MEELIRVIEKKIVKSRCKGTWIYTVDLRSSCIYSDQFILLSAEISGEGSVKDFIKTRISYLTHQNSDKVIWRCKKFNGLSKAVQYVWDFPENYSMCLNCCSLVKKDKSCEDCLFFQSFLKQKNKKEICGICQEETYRTVLPCHHHFHKSCLLKMDPEDLKCPLCRHPVSEEIVCDLFDDSDDDSQEEIYSDYEESSQTEDSELELRFTVD